MGRRRKCILATSQHVQKNGILFLLRLWRANKATLSSRDTSRKTGLPRAAIDHGSWNVVLQRWQELAHPSYVEVIVVGHVHRLA